MVEHSSRRHLGHSVINFGHRGTPEFAADISHHMKSSYIEGLWLPHMNACLASSIHSARKTRLWEVHYLPERLIIAEQFATAYREQGRYTVALELYTSILQRREKSLPSTHPDILFSWNQVAVCMCDLSEDREVFEICHFLVVVAWQETGDASLETTRGTQNLAHFVL